jgi:hypothetical protein
VAPPAEATAKVKPSVIKAASATGDPIPIIAIAATAAVRVSVNTVCFDI